jgi:integrase
VQLMAHLFCPDVGRLIALDFASVAHVPVLFDGAHRYCTAHNRYLRERALGEWNAKAPYATAGGGEIPRRATLITAARHLGVYIDWCKAKGVDWRETDYSDGVLAYQNGMAQGTWSLSGTRLARSTANQRADEVTSFLIWAARKKLRSPISVKYRTTLRQVQSGQSSIRTFAQVSARSGRLKTSATAQITRRVPTLPRAEEVRDWLIEVRNQRGYAKYLACCWILVTGSRREETVSVTEDQIPSAGDLEGLRRQGQHAGPIQLTDTKGDRPRTIQVPLDYLEELRIWIDGRRMKLRRDWSRNNRNKVSSKRLFVSDSRQYPGAPISAQTLYMCFHDVAPHPRVWYPHFARHIFACYHVLNTLENEAKGLGRTLTEMGADWINSRGKWCLRTLQRQLGHQSDATTEVYLRWLVTAAGVAEIASGWHQFLSGEDSRNE